MDSIVEAIEGNEWQTLIGLLLLALTALARDVTTRAGVKGLAAKIISTLSSYLSGVAVLLPVAPQWWHAALIALGTPIASQGLRDLLVDLVRWLMKRKAKAAVLLCFLVPALDGCTTRRAQTSVQTSLTSIAAGVNAADRIVADRLLDESEDAVAEALVRSNLDPSLNGSDVYAGLMEPWEQAVIGLEATVLALRVMQRGVSLWIDTGDLEEGLPGLCTALGETTRDLISFLREVEVDVPPQLEVAPDAVALVCTLITDFVRE